MGRSSLLKIFSLKSLVTLIYLLTSITDTKQEGFPLHEQEFVVKLTDTNFEHETQASSGGTTGSWLIWFHTSRDDTPIAGQVPEAEFWTDNHIILASLDAKANPSTRARFNLKYGNSKLPCFIFIHKGKYYKLQDPPKGYVFNWDKISNFALKGYAERSEPMDIPPPRGMMDEVNDFLAQVKSEFGGVYFQSMGYFFMFMAGLALIQKIFVDPKPESKKEKRA